MNGLTPKQQNIQDQYGLQGLIDDGLELESFGDISGDVVLDQGRLTENCHTYFKMKLWAVGFFITALAAPVTVGLILGSLTTVVLGLGIAGGVVAVIAFIALIYFQVRSSPARRRLEILDLMVNLDSDVKAKKLLQCLLKLTEGTYKQRAGEDRDLDTDRFERLATEMHFLEVVHGYTSYSSLSCAYNTVLIGISMGIAHLRTGAISEGEETASLICDARKLGKAFCLAKTPPIQSPGSVAFELATNDKLGHNPFLKIQFSACRK
jgi:hypothetical protein